MDDHNNNPISLLLHGCNLAKDLESHISNLVANYPQILSQKCDEIIQVFTYAKHNINALHPLYHGDHHFAAGSTAVQEQIVPSEARGKEVVAEVTEGDMNTGDSDDGEEDEHRQPRDAGGSSSSMQQRWTKRSSSRSDDHCDRRTVRVAAPRVGNLEMPPEDGFTWRKYGQKEILNSKHPRSYYRCTHQKLYNCPAKKQVQRLDEDPYTFEILYRGEHTCHNSSTAPTTPPLPSSQALQNIFFSHQQLLTVDSPTHQWLTMDFQSRHRVHSEDAHTVEDPSQHQRNDQVMDLSHQNQNNPVLDLADVMFNSGSSSTNSMEHIFPRGYDKWDHNKNNRD